MEEKKNIAVTLQEAKEWYKGNNPTLKELALKAFSKEELEKQELPKTWEEHCKLHVKNKTICYYINDISNINQHVPDNSKEFLTNRNLCQTEEDAEAFLALMQLRALWHDYVGDFKFNWKENNYYSIYHSILDELVLERAALPSVLSFPTKELATQFLNNFKDLLEIAKPLL